MEQKNYLQFDMENHANDDDKTVVHDSPEDIQNHTEKLYTLPTHAQGKGSKKTELSYVIPEDGRQHHTYDIHALLENPKAASYTEHSFVLEKSTE
jgi:hypothetical protein